MFAQDEKEMIIFCLEHFTKRSSIVTVLYYITYCVLRVIIARIQENNLFYECRDTRESIWRAVCRCLHLFKKIRKQNDTYLIKKLYCCGELIVTIGCRRVKLVGMLQKKKKIKTTNGRFN